MTRATTTAVLSWDRTGRIACERHGPMRSSDTWVWDGWRRMTAYDLAAYLAKAGRDPACESCAAKARARGEAS